MQGMHSLASDEAKRPYSLLQGHSGPVYSVSFSPFADFLLSSSSDNTSNSFNLSNNNCISYTVANVFILVANITLYM
jgi:transcription initiation factor TFIID subunit 5